MALNVNLLLGRWCYAHCKSVVCNASVFDETTAKYLRFSAVSIVSLKTKLEGGPLDRGLNLYWSGLRLGQAIVCYILLPDSSSQLLIVVALGIINMRSTTVHCQVRYSNRFDTTTATLRHVEACS